MVVSTASLSAVALKAHNLNDEVSMYLFCNSTACMDLSATTDSNELFIEQALRQQLRISGAPINHSHPLLSTLSSPSSSPSQEAPIDVEAYMSFRSFMSWLSLAVLVVGLVGNLVSFVILIHPKMRISTNVFLASLCVSGFVALLGLLANSIIYDMCYYYGLYSPLQFLSYFYPYVYPIITTFQMSSISLTVCVSLNQFVYIYFSGAKLRTQKTSDKDCRNALKVCILY